MTAASDVTIVVSCYEQQAYIGEALQSALGQTQPAQVVMVDDGSSDGSVEVAERLGVECHALPHQGALKTFRAAVDLVQTSFYCLLNGDDVLDPRYVELTRPLMENEHVGFVYTGFEWFGAADRLVEAPPFDARSLAYGNYAHAASLVRTEAYRSVGGFDPSFADHHEDWALWVAMTQQGWIGAPVNEPLLRYRQHETGSRNRGEAAKIEEARWRLFRRYPGAYGATGFARLAASRLKLAVTGT